MPCPMAMPTAPACAAARRPDDCRGARQADLRMWSASTRARVACGARSRTAKICGVGKSPCARVALPCTRGRPRRHFAMLDPVLRPRNTGGWAAQLERADFYARFFCGCETSCGRLFGGGVTGAGARPVGAAGCGWQLPRQHPCVWIVGRGDAFLADGRRPAAGRLQPAGGRAPWTRRSVRTSARCTPATYAVVCAVGGANGRRWGFCARVACVASGAHPPSVLHGPPDDKQTVCVCGAVHLFVCNRPLQV
jgi:hypothetical protein